MYLDRKNCCSTPSRSQAFKKSLAYSPFMSYSSSTPYHRSHDLKPNPSIETDTETWISTLPRLARVAHAGHVKRCLTGLPDSQVDLDSSRLAIIFYCIGTLDLLGLVPDKVSEADMEMWREWIWEQYVSGPYGAGFRPSPFMNTNSSANEASALQPSSPYDTPHLITTYTAILTLAILRDDFKRLDRQGLRRLVGSCQRVGERGDGSFSTIPLSSSTSASSGPRGDVGTDEGRDTDLRTLYCAFVLCHLLDDWSTIDVEKAMEFVGGCRTYEGGYGISINCEAQGGSTYTALASIYLAPQPQPSSTPSGRSGTTPSLPLSGPSTQAGSTPMQPGSSSESGPDAAAGMSGSTSTMKTQTQTPRLTPQEISQTTSYLLRLQQAHSSGGDDDGGDQDKKSKRSGHGGFAGRTNKDADACYCFWCGAGLKILGKSHLVDSRALVSFLADCQFRFGGIGKAPGENPDPYHTYLALAALSMYTPFRSRPHPSTSGVPAEPLAINAGVDTVNDPNLSTWTLDPLDPLINAREETARWAREKVRMRPE
ncbi:hypothetical protein D9758_016190 [Tetrapyrgos nigripes]|uniref:Prenyltransferase alpha-alpha toroid domain-containing protein n=1 Tax=Tetrapyrgos nigripes TaxID=182062 RepID=A0A8H5C4A0_9AGAR|nr:hypothetical protein D9758_016190 [Tetrapyrgos nigripes]